MNDNSINHETMNNGDRSKRPELTGAEKKTQERRQRTESNCERLLTLLAQQPDNTMRHPNVGSYLKEVLGIESANDWVDVNTEVIKTEGLVSIRKSDPGLARPDEYRLDVPENPEVLGLRYLTEEVIELARSQASEPAN